MGNTQNQSKKKIELSGWRELNSVAVTENKYGEWSAPLKVDELAFIIIVNDSIYEYNILYNKWIKLSNIKKTTGKADAQYRAIKYDKKGNKILFFVTYTHFTLCRYLELDLKSFKCIHKSPMVEPKTSFYGSIFVENKLHVLGYGHYIWNRDKQNLERKNGLNVSGVDDKSSLIYLSKKKKFLIIQIKAGLPTVYQYNFLDKYWIDIGVDIQSLDIETKYKNYQNSMALCCKDEKYILVISRQEILIFEVDTRIIKQSIICCPFGEGKCEAILMNDEVRLLLILYGYIRRVMNSLIPQDIIDLIFLMFGDNEYVYLMHEESGKHCKISVDEILKGIDVN